MEMKHIFDENQEPFYALRRCFTTLMRTSTFQNDKVTLNYMLVFKISV